jgi:hypothetical protein
MTTEVTKKINEVIAYDVEGNATIVFEKDVHLVTNGDFLITAKGEVSILSQTALSLDCALLLLNCRMSRQIRQMKHDLRLQFIDMLGGMPSITEEQREYFEESKKKVVSLLELTEDETSHLNQDKEKE